MCASILAAFLFVSVLPIHGEEKIYSDMIRLHVIAASDSEKDQTVKLQVRDAVLAVVECLMENVESQEEAAAVIEGAKDEICAAAKAVLVREGFDYPVSVDLGLENYPERVYEGFTLPAGQYTSLRVILDGGEGQNWWCVLYPNLCFLDGTCKIVPNQGKENLKQVVTEEEYEWITTGKPVKAKSYILEQIRMP